MEGGQLQIESNGHMVVMDLANCPIIEICLAGFWCREGENMSGQQPIFGGIAIGDRDLAT